MQSCTFSISLRYFIFDFIYLEMTFLSCIKSISYDLLLMNVSIKERHFFY